jgi:hypothetical protein
MMAAGLRRSRALEYKLCSSRALSASEESTGRWMCSAEHKSERRRNSRPILSAARVRAKPAPSGGGVTSTPPQRATITRL